MVASISYARLQESKDGFNKELHPERIKRQDIPSALVDCTKKENYTAVGRLESARAAWQMGRIKFYCSITLGILLFLSGVFLNISMKCSHSKAMTQSGCSIDKMDYVALLGNESSTNWISAQEPVQNMLIDAVKRDDDDAIVAAVRCGASLHQLYRKLTPLHLAARLGTRRAAEALLRLGAEVERPDPEWRMTPLHEAAWAGRDSVAALLLRAGASIRALCRRSWTPLHVAAYRGHLNVTKVLVEAGAEVNAKDIKGETPLRQALEKGHLSVVSYLRFLGGHE